MSRYSDEIK